MQAAFIRYVFGLVLLAPIFLQLFRQRPDARRLGLHAARGIVHGIGVMLWFYAMARLPIAEVTGEDLDGLGSRLTQRGDPLVGAGRGGASTRDQDQVTGAVLADEVEGQAPPEAAEAPPA